MLDPAICASMALGTPMLDVGGLAALDRLLKALGLRRTCSDELPPTEEIHHAIPASTKPSRQLAISLDRPVLNGMTPFERSAAIRRLARLLMEAAGADPTETADDQR